MALRVNYNYQADFGHVNLMKNERNLNTSLERLESGLRINSAKDDAAGLFIADQLNLVAKALDQGSRNANDGISAAQIAESTLAQVYDKLTSMYTKASQAATDTNDPNARAALQRDIAKIVDAIDRITKASEFNGIKLLDGTFQEKKIQYGARAGQSLDINISASTAKDLGAKISTLSDQQSVRDAANDFATLLTNNDNWTIEKADTLTIGSTAVDLSKYEGKVVSADVIADEINAQTDFAAYAETKSQASTKWTDITVESGKKVELNFYVGADKEKFTVTFDNSSGTNDLTVTLDKLIENINNNSNGLIKASKVTKDTDSYLVLENSDGKTIGLEVDNGNGNNSIDLSTLLNVSSANVAGGDTGSAAVSGEIRIVGDEEVTTSSSGLDALGLKAKSELYKDDSGNIYIKNLEGLNVTSYSGAKMAMKIIESAIQTVDKNRSELGSIQQNLQTIIENNDFAATQTREAESRIRNVDFAKEMAEFTKSQTLMQSGVAMLAQAKQLPQMMLQLLR